MRVACTDPRSDGCDSLRWKGAVEAQIADPTEARVAAGLTRGVLEAGFKQLNAGVDVEVLVASGAAAAEALVTALRD